MGHSERQVPRDIYEEFRSVGVHVFRRKLGNSAISGLFIVHPTAGKCALVNYSEDVYRQRFSAAHEMAHAIFDIGSGPSVSYFKPQGRDMLEVRANRFASCYLMPPEFLRHLSSPRVLVRVRRTGLGERAAGELRRLGHRSKRGWPG